MGSPCLCDSRCPHESCVIQARSWACHLNQQPRGRWKRQASRPSGATGPFYSKELREERCEVVLQELTLAKILGQQEAGGLGLAPVGP